MTRHLSLLCAVAVGVLLGAGSIRGRQVEVSNVTVTGKSPLTFMDYNMRELFVCHQTVTPKDKSWNIITASDCQMGKGVTLDDIANGILAMSRDFQKQIKEAEKRP